METLTTETQIEVRRPSLLLDVRPYQCSFVRSPDEKGLDPLGRGISNRGNSLHNAGGRLEGMPSADRGTGTRDEFSGSDEADPFADFSNVEPMTYPEGCDDPDARRWYSRGRTDKMLEMHEQMMPMVERVIEIASR